MSSDLAFLLVAAVVWLFPLLYALAASLRNYAYTAEHGYLSTGGWTLQNYVNAWETAGFTQKFINSAIITVCAVVLTLLTNTFVAYAVARNMDKRFFRFLYYFFLAMMFVGVPIGAAIIIGSWLLTGWFVNRSNGEFDTINNEIVREATK